jgi:putative ABC transport system substrate-binding protein
MIGRREFITLVGGAAAWPLAAHAQQAGKLPTIGFLGAATASGWNSWVATFEKRLRELGWIDGRTVGIEYRWLDGRNDRSDEIAAEFVRLKVDVIVAGGIAVPALKRATSVIPIVFALSTDPIGDSLVASLARPGGNVTGLSNQANDLAGKRLQLLREVVPALRRLAILVNVNYPAAMLEMRDVQTAARMSGSEVTVLEMRRSEDIGPAFEAIKGAAADALYVVSEPLVTSNRSRINILAQDARLPTIHATREFVEAGMDRTTRTNSGAPPSW